MFDTSNESSRANFGEALLNHQISPILSNFVMAWEVQHYTDGTPVLTETHVEIMQTEELRLFVP